VSRSPGRGSGAAPPRSQDQIEARPFDLRWHGATDEGEGARWWNESRTVWRAAKVASEPSRRTMFLAVGGVTAGMMVFNIARCIAERDTDPQVSMEALKVQQQLGWNTGQVGARLAFGPELNLRDVDGQGLRTEAMTSLWTALRPLQPAWAPYYVPTLFKSLSDERSGELRAQMQPVHTDAMDQAFRRGEGLDDVFGASGAPDDVALIIDLPGPEAVALATALSARFEPVWLFDNWPHPRGVVPSHLVLGAMLYYLPLLERKRATRAAELPAPADAGAPADSNAGAKPIPSFRPAARARTAPMFILDAQRLAPYSEAADQFDNRYLARVPSASALREAGYRRVLYVRPTGQSPAQLQELDDLNDDFVAYRDRDIDVRVVAADAFQLDASLPATSSARATQATPSHLYAWGGSYHTHVTFWHVYGWSTISPPRGSVFMPARPYGASAGATYRPVVRPTIFSSRIVGGGSGIGKQRPSGFGVVSVRQSASSGHITSVGSSRSGSFGRLGGSSFG